MCFSGNSNHGQRHRRKASIVIIFYLGDLNGLSHPVQESLNGNERSGISFQTSEAVYRQDSTRETVFPDDEEHNPPEGKLLCVYIV